MTHKRSRTKEEKILDAINLVGNLTQEYRTKMFDILIKKDDINPNVQKYKKFIVKELHIPAHGKNTKIYWLARGWNNAEAYFKCKEHHKTLPKRKSPFSVEFWLEQINPETNIFYTIEEATFQRNSRRPINKEYWMVKGFSEEDAIIKAEQTISDNCVKGNMTFKNKDIIEHKSISKRCVEYWMLRGYTEEQSKEKVSEHQLNFSLEICIEKYGIEQGTEIWKDRQKRWQNTLKSKSSEEIENINRRKATKINYGTLYGKTLNIKAIVYLLKIFNEEEIFYKVGITSKSIHKRYGFNKLKGYKYEVLMSKFDTVKNCYELEQKIIKDNKNIVYVPKIKFEGWTECFSDEPIISY